MSKELPPTFEGPYGDEMDMATGDGRRFNRKLIFGIGAFGMLAFYLALVVATQVDSVFFPGNELKPPGAGILEKVGVDSGDTPDFATIDERTNVLVLGLDLRRDEPDNLAARTDSIMVVTMDPYAKIGGAFSIPRDTWVEIPDGYGGYKNDRINVAYELGEYTYKDYDGGGPGLIKDTIEHNFDIPIDYYVVLDFNDFIDLIDELGGIDINVPDYAYDPAYSDCSGLYDDACYTYPVEFTEGREHMDGERALAYARIRASDDDFKRIERQQLVVKAVAKRATDLGTVFSNAPSLYGKYKDAVKTDIPGLQVPGLALLAKQIGPDNIRTVSMAEATYPCNRCPGAVLLWNEAKVEELKAMVFSNAPLPEEEATVQILNGTQTPDLAAYTATLLRGQGLKQLSTDELVGGPLYDRTMIVDVDGERETAQRLAEWLGLPNSRITDEADADAEDYIDQTADVIIVLGADVDLTELESRNASLQETTTGS